ncbi:SRPBCC family protein [Nocardia sp. IBHARD005]|uniref:SRPBCC family protein n=1 Tax=Nocardia sp. IBHARD005 TaxID=3457765 RepID=UPI004058D8E2
MNSITAQREIAAPVQHVWAVLTDLDSAVETLSGVTRIERLTGDGYRVGTRWRETRKILGKEATEEMEVTEVDPEHRTTLIAESGGITYRTEFTLTPTTTGTNLTMTFAGTSTTTGWRAVIEKVTSPLGTAVARKMMAADLTDIARAAQAR